MELIDSTENLNISKENIPRIPSTTVANELDYEKILEKIGFGKTQWILLFISGLLTVTSISAQQSVGIIAIASQCEFEMNQGQKGVMMAACVTGIFLSTYFWGYVSDAIGRRTVLLYGTLITNLLQLITMFVTSVWLFNLINLFMGISLGGVTAAIYAYLSEFNTSKYRAVVINYSTMFVSITAIYVPATAWLVLSADWSIAITNDFIFQPWRLIILLSMLPGLIGALMLLPFPESPKLLLAQNKEMEAVQAVDWICKFNIGRDLTSLLKTSHFKLKRESLPDTDIIRNNSCCGILLDVCKAVIPLFQKPHGTHFIMSVVAVFGMFFSSSGMQIWYPEIVNRLTVKSNSSTVCEILDASFAKQIIINSSLQNEITCDSTISNKTYIDNMIVGFAFLLGFIIQGVLLNPLGRKRVILLALPIAVCSGLLLHFVTNSIFVMILFCLYILMPGLSISIMIGALVDMLPTNLRGKAVSIAFTMGRLGIIVAANLIGLMLESWCNTTFLIFTASMIVSATLAYFLPI